MKAIGAILVTMSILIGLVDPTRAIGPQMPKEQQEQTYPGLLKQSGDGSVAVPRSILP